MGFSGQLVEDAYRYYASEVTVEQRFISRGLSQVFAAWYEPVMRNVDTKILPIQYAGGTNDE